MSTEIDQAWTQLNGLLVWQADGEIYSTTIIHLLPEGNNTRITGFVDYATINEKIMTFILEPDIPIGQREFDKKGLESVGYQSTGLSYAYPGTYSVVYTNGRYTLEAKLFFANYKLPININLNAFP